MALFNTRFCDYVFFTFLCSLSFFDAAVHNAPYCNMAIYSNPHRRRYADATNYPDLFRKVYWGAFTLETSLDGKVVSPEADIVANRNYFVEHFNIKNVRKPLKAERIMLRNGMDRTTNCQTDHEELYVDQEGAKIQVFSHHPNNGTPGGTWTMIPPMYCPSQQTWMGRVETHDIRDQRKVCGM